MKNYILSFAFLISVACASSSDTTESSGHESERARLVSYTSPELFAKLEPLLQKAARNRAQLEQVILHYSEKRSDSLKLQAALFLLESMESKHTLAGEGYAAYQLFFQRADQLWKQGVLTKKDHDLVWKNRIRNLWTTTKKEIDSLSQPEWIVQPDLTHVSSAYLIQNIDQAFANWQHSRWAAGVSFESFCEYILPYRVFEEPLEPWRQMLASKFDSIRLHVTDIKQATTLVNQKLAQEIGTINLYEYPNVMIWSDLQKLKAGKCAHKVFATVTAMRTLGIPVAVDFTPNWANYASGHVWCSLIMPDGSIYPFEAADEPSLSVRGVAPHKVRTNKKAAKIYRITQQKQPQSLAMQVQDETEIPPFFRDPYMKDVTSEYNDPTTDVTLRLSVKEKDRFAYLCVFDNKTWVPVHWARIQPDGAVVFTGMGREITYVPMQYQDMKLVPAGDAFTIHKNGRIEPLHSDTSHLESITVTRKYMISPWLQKELDRMIGGVFQGATKADFSDAVNLYSIPTPPLANVQQVNVSYTGAFRYVRFWNPHQICRINELYWYGIQGHDKPVRLKGKLMHSTRMETGKPQAIDDGDVLSGFTSLDEKGGWIGYDLGQAAQITRIAFSPPSDGNGIQPGNEYELFYWKQGWKPVGLQKATQTHLVFEKLPAHSLFLLHNRTGGTEERIFTYVKGKQIWW